MAEKKTGGLSVARLRRLDEAIKRAYGEDFYQSLKAQLNAGNGKDLCLAGRMLLEPRKTYETLKNFLGSEGMAKVFLVVLLERMLPAEEGVARLVEEWIQALKSNDKLRVMRVLDRILG